MCRVLVVATLAACAANSAVDGPPTVGPGGKRDGSSSDAVDVWVTYGDRSRLISWDGKKPFTDDAAVTSSTLTVDDATSFQTIDGFGAALTDAAAWLISNRLSDAQRDAALQHLFGFDDGDAGISFLRLPLGSSDLARSRYTYDDGAADPTLARLSIAHDEDAIIPLAKRAKSIDGSLGFLGTPWSAPTWMKTSASLIGGKLDPASYVVYARYLRGVVDAYRSSGVEFSALTIQNEPQYEPADYPGMRYEWYDELNFVRGTLASAVDGTGVKLLTFDHNWDLAWYPEAVMNEGRAIYAGSAWHCYGGDESAMGAMHDAYPDKDIYLTECSGTFAASDFAANLKWNLQHLFIGGTRNWARTVLLWSLALDPSGEPHTGGCANCRGVITIDQASGAVSYNEEYYAIAHFARFVWPGAIRVGTTDSADGTFIGVAFRNVDGSHALVVLNQGAANATFKMVYDGRSISEPLPPSGVATVFW
jgi:glucosylceramidase